MSSVAPSLSQPLPLSMEAWLQLRSHLRVYTVAHNQPLTFWRPVDGYLLTFETEIILWRDRSTVRPFGRLLCPQAVWPLPAHRLIHAIAPYERVATVGWLSATTMRDLFTRCSEVAVYCIKRMVENEEHLSKQLGYNLHRSARPRTVRLLLKLWDLSDNRFINWSQAELAIVLNTNRESVTALLNGLRQRGLLRLHYRRIEILNRWALQQIADDY